MNDTSHLPLQLRVSGSLRSLIGAIIWLIAVVAIGPRPLELEWAQAALVLAALVLVPLCVDLIEDQRFGTQSSFLRSAINVAQLPAGLLFLSAYAFAPGLLAALLAVPWLLTTALIAWWGVDRIRQRGWKPLPALCCDIGLIFLLVGGAWATADRFGLRPLDFEPAIVLLTAIHFHYAGFVLPVVTGLAARERNSVTARAAVGGVIISVPLVAIGITATQLGLSPAIEILAAWAMSLAAMLTAWLHIRLSVQSNRPLAARCLWMIAAVSLVFAMVLAALYGSRHFISVQWLDIPWMRALHGSANALGFGVGSVLGWVVARERV